MPHARPALRPSAAALALALAACGPSKPVPVPDIATTTFATSLGVDLTASTKLPNGEYVRDLAAGTGAAVTAGAALSVHYTGWLADGTRFDSNVGGAAFVFRYGAGEVITGWDQGLDGVKASGQRQLIIPPSLGYGVEGAPPSIPSNAILVFDVTVDAVQ
jgi:FKBP-type peptidyl-prolyl cis-trans isomerase